jgi:hypothetical protein
MMIKADASRDAALFYVLIEQKCTSLSKRIIRGVTSPSPPTRIGCAGSGLVFAVAAQPEGNQHWPSDAAGAGTARQHNTVEH